MNIIGQIEKDDILMIFVVVDRYFLYRIDSYKNLKWKVNNIEFIGALDEHLMCVEE